MATIKEDYVTFETAKLLKEKGFNAEIDTYYSPEGQFKIWCPNGLKSYLDNNGTETWWWKCIAPTQQMAMKWLREVHNISVRPRYDEVEDEKERLWYVWFFDILSMKPYKTLVEIEQGYSTYEEACESGIKYCIEHLI